MACASCAAVDAGQTMPPPWRNPPVVTSATIAALRLIPLLLATGIGSEIQRPLAAVVVGGLVSSTLLTLFVLPCLYERFSKRRFNA